MKNKPVNEKQLRQRIIDFLTRHEGEGYSLGHIQNKFGKNGNQFRRISSIINSWNRNGIVFVGRLAREKIVVVKDKNVVIKKAHM